MKIHVLSANCKGPNDACKRAHAEGRHIHMIPMTDRSEDSLVMPGYHFTSEHAGRDAIQLAWDTAPVIETDAQLYEARAWGVAYKLRPGWVDPSMRR